MKDSTLTYVVMPIVFVGLFAMVYFSTRDADKRWCAKAIRGAELCEKSANCRTTPRELANYKACKTEYQP